MLPISQSFRCLDEVTRRGSVRKAAESLNVTASAVNQQILNFERQIGTPLFDRLPRGMQLTAAGEIVIAAVRRSQRDFDNALAQLEDLRALRRGHVNVGVSHSSTDHMVPAVIESMMEKHPGLTYTVRSAPGDVLLREVANGEIDVAYCLRRPPPQGVEEVRAWRQHLGVVVSPDHELASGPAGKSRKLRFRDCLGWPLILISQDMELRMLMERIDPGTLRTRRPLVETSSVSMARRLAASGRAVTFLLPENVAHDVDAGYVKWIGLQDAKAHSHGCLYQRSGYTTSVAMALFLRELEEHIESIRIAFEDVSP